MKALRLVVVRALGVALAVACGTPKNEASTVLDAIDRYRRGENVQKPALASALEKVACSDAEVCETKDACLKSAQATARSIVLKNEVERGLADVEAKKLDKDDPAAQALRPKLEESMKLLDEGYRLMPACDQKSQVLKRKYSL